MMFFTLLTTLLVPPSVLAAPCCATSVAAPALITTDSVAQITARSTASRTIGTSRADGSSLFHGDDNRDDAINLSLLGAYTFAPRWQLHATVPTSFRSRSLSSSHESHLGLGDISTGVAFEAVEELFYSAWKPRVWFYADISAPTGRSIYDSATPLAANSHGRGAWAGAVGAFILKTWKSIDLSLLLAHQRFLPRTVKIDQSERRLSLGAATAASLGGGYSFSDYRIGLSVGPTYEDATTLSGSSGSESRLVWDVGAQLSAQIQEFWSLTLSYSDQTLLGPTFNATLSRSASLMLVKRFGAL